ncbi:hypothetical protein GGX14DRAFT_594769 [Mycena pura]|uniref:Uncharacterized protein n=1 Tax=Mycena pura TaxID=153505 RepID=A0AAD6VPY1_9AGAR|nr:hypothetical protein GGX14DRAFT_594769 [Mycena pura]
MGRVHSISPHFCPRITMSYIHSCPHVSTNIYASRGRRASYPTTPPTARRASLTGSIASFVGIKAPVPPPPARAPPRPVVQGCARKPALKRRSLSDSGVPRTDSFDSDCSTASSSSASSSSAFSLSASSSSSPVRFDAGTESREVTADGGACSGALTSKSHPKRSTMQRSIRKVNLLFRGSPPPPPRVIPVLPPPPDMDALSIICVEEDAPSPPSPVSPGARKVRFCVSVSPSPPSTDEEEEDEEPTWCELMVSLAPLACLTNEADVLSLQ